MGNAPAKKAFGGPVAGGMPQPAPTSITTSPGGLATAGGAQGLQGPGGFPAPPPGVSAPLPTAMPSSPMGVAGPQALPPPSSSPVQMPQLKRGGKVTPPANDPLQRKVTRGAILSAVPGRTDAHFTHVPSGSYVVPADIVSGRGEGNTIAGAEALQKLFKMPPYGGTPMKMGKGPGVPGRGTFPKIKKRFAAGGAPDPNTGKPVRVNLAGGEIVVPPENLMAAVHPDLKTAHEIMDKWVLDERKKLRKTLARLPGPVKS